MNAIELLMQDPNIRKLLEDLDTQPLDNQNVKFWYEWGSKCPNCHPRWHGEFIRCISCDALWLKIGLGVDRKKDDRGFRDRMGAMKLL